MFIKTAVFRSSSMTRRKVVRNAVSTSRTLQGPFGDAAAASAMIAASMCVLMGTQSLPYLLQQEQQQQRHSTSAPASVGSDNNDLSSVLQHLASAKMTSCEAEDDREQQQQSPTDMIEEHHPISEAEEFQHCLNYYIQQIPWYIKEWKQKEESNSNWPKSIPSNSAEISSIEYDLRFCKPCNALALDQTMSSIVHAAHCNKQAFRAAVYYLQSEDANVQMKGFKQIKSLAEAGYPDAMCLYGIILNEGRVRSIEADPEQAVVWWKRCVDEHSHIQSTYEYAIALYMGDGVAENAPAAVYYFEKAANLHVGAAYMLGECLLDGVGTPRNRAAALEWLVVAAELGHRGAQRRVLALLEAAADKTSLDDPSSAPLSSSSSDAASSSPQRQQQQQKQQSKIAGRNSSFNQDREELLERRYTIGGGSQNPHIRKRRSMIVEDSRHKG